MADSLTLTIDGKTVLVENGATLLEAARQLGPEVPTICYHQATTSNGLCRMCVVEVEGQRLLQPACIVKAVADMKVQTRSERVVRARKTILEMLSSTMELSEAPEVLTMIDEYSADTARFPPLPRDESPLWTHILNSYTQWEAEDPSLSLLEGRPQSEEYSE